MAFLNLEVLGKQVSPAENESLFGMFSLRWSRACLGNMIIFSITWRTKDVFSDLLHGRVLHRLHVDGPVLAHELVLSTGEASASLGTCPAR